MSTTPITYDMILWNEPIWRHGLRYVGCRWCGTKNTYLPVRIVLVWDETHIRAVLNLTCGCVRALGSADRIGTMPPELVAAVALVTE